MQKKKKAFLELGQVLYLAFVFNFVCAFFFLHKDCRRWCWAVAAAVFGSTMVLAIGWRWELLGRGRAI